MDLFILGFYFRALSVWICYNLFCRADSAGIIQHMKDKLSYSPFLFSTLFLLLVGWGGLALLLNFTLPTLWPRWTLYALIVLAGTGTTLPISFLINNTFFPGRPNLAEVIVRESIGVGFYFALLTWLSIGGALNFPISVWLGLGLLVLEYIFRMSEAANKVENDSPQHPVG
jgi:hypothetical protein